jgi:UDP-N-acetylmuramoyl-tripeptide--D-alanyl-D-alanine ligase
MLELGEKSGYYHRIIADRIAESGIKKVYAYGREVVATVIACKRAGFEDISHFTDIGELVADLKKEAREGDLIMVKGSRAMKLDRVVNELTGN